MDSVFFSRLSGVRLPFASLASEYIDWCVGSGNHAKRRRTRLAQGIPADWTRGSLLAGGKFTGLYDLAVEVRASETHFVLRFTHRDDKKGEILWHTFARLTEVEGSITIEHAVARSAPREAVLDPVVGCPAVLRDIGTRPQAGNSDGFRGKVIHLNADDIDAFVKYELLSPNRQCPVVVISPRNSDNTLLVSPHLLARELFGMASVACLADRIASHRWTDALGTRGFDPKLGVYDGAVRIYRAPLTPIDRVGEHPLLLRTLIESVPVDNRNATVAGMVGQRIVRGTIPPTFFSLIEDFDRSQQAMLISKLTAAAPATSMDEAHHRIAELEKLVADSSALVGLYSDDAKKAQAALLAAQERLEEALEGQRQAVVERDEKSLHITNLNQKLEVAKKASTGPEVARLTSLLHDLAKGAPPEIQLKIIETLRPGRVVVLESGRESARRSAEFRHPEVCFSLLTRLVDDYWSALADSKGDAVARKVFGKEEFASRESETVMNRDGAMKRRTFTYDGKPLIFASHLKFGIKDSVAETLRIHFHWDAAKKVIVIGHCGPHLDFK